MESYRKLLFDNPSYKISNISKFLGHVSVNHTMAGVGLHELQENIAAFESALADSMMDVSGVEHTIEEIKYAIQRLDAYLTSSVDTGFTDRDACVFVSFLHQQYDELIEAAEELDAEGNG